ncbi:hypothetical protein [Singulisphaera sp. PoT]|uniref:hypothetical protein n=1 Tax=Singulisphaera sp. PoT TaxID=3411797 RepID=UPI003BF55924
MDKSLDRKLAAIHANPNCREFILADAKDADMAFGIGAPGQSPEAHSGELRVRTLEEYRDQMRMITRQGLVDIMLMSASTNYALTIREKLFENSHVTPAVRANDTTDVHIARGSIYAKEPSQPFRTANLDHIQCGHLDCEPGERSIGANLGLYSVTFNNDMAHDIATLERFHEFRAEAERKGFRYFLEVFDPNMPNALPPDVLPGFINDMIARMLAGVAPAGRPVFLKMVYHGPKAMEELFKYDPHLVIGILGGSSGTTFDAFQLLADAQKYGAKVALFGRKINSAENQLAFVQFLRLIVDGQISPVEAVKAYHSVLGKLGIRPHRPLEVDLQTQAASMSYGGSSTSVTVPPKPKADAPAPAVTAASCQCHGEKKEAKPAASTNGHACGCNDKPAKVEVVSAAPARSKPEGKNGFPSFGDGRPDFSKMDVGQRLAYHRERLGLGRN